MYNYNNYIISYIDLRYDLTGKCLHFLLFMAHRVTLMIALLQVGCMFIIIYL